MKVSTRLAAGSALVFALLLLVLGYAALQVGRLASVSAGLAGKGLQAARLSVEEIGDLDALEVAARKALLTRDPDYARRARELAEPVERRLEAIRGLPLTGEVRAAADRLERAWRPVAAGTGLLPDGALQEAYLDDLRRAQGEAQALAAAAQAAMAGEAQRAQVSARRTWAIFLAVAVLALASGAGVLLLTARSIQRPLSRVARAMDAVAAGRFGADLEATGPDELAKLAQDFNAMSRRLGEMDRMKRDLLSHVSHELKAPLAAIHESDRVLLEEIPGPLNADQRRLVELHLASSRRLFGMIAKLLDLSRIEAGAMEYDMAPRDLVPLLRGAAEEMELTARTTGVELRVELPPEPLPVTGDGERLRQVVANLLENAVKFSPAAGDVLLAAASAGGLPPEAPAAVREVLSAHRTAGFVLVRVADRGPGVPEAHRDRIFERFHQVAGGGGRRGGGVGLGLALCREIASAHGGAVWVGERAGGGSMFTLALPRAETAERLERETG